MHIRLLPSCVRGVNVARFLSHEDLGRAEIVHFDQSCGEGISDPLAVGVPLEYLVSVVLQDSSINSQDQSETSFRIGIELIPRP